MSSASAQKLQHLSPTGVGGERLPQRQPCSPVVKWAGGKKRLLGQLLGLMPTEFERYFEPFMGGAAVFLHLQPERAVLADINADLVNLYTVVRDNPDGLIAEMAQHRYEKDHYYAVRAQDPTELGRVARAARMLFLNRTCFNGLYRVNRRGQFNVPFGRYSNPTLCDETKVRKASEAFGRCDILNADYASVLESAKSGDFVYLDPPYFPLTRTSNFTSYTKLAFSADDQRTLASVVDELTERGVKVMQSNSDTPFIRELYAHHKVDVVYARRAISRDPSKRGPVAEVVIRNY